MTMAERPKLLYVLVSDENVDNQGMSQQSRKIKSLTPVRYTRPVLQSTLQLMGCKPRHAFKISKSVFVVLRNGFPAKLVGVSSVTPNDDVIMHTEKLHESLCNDHGVQDNTNEHVYGDHLELGFTKMSESYKQHYMVMVSRETFLDVICDALAEYRYIGPNQKADLMLACRVRERRTSVTILLCGTSGCGKSTLSSLLASRLGITTVVSTDSIRHMMRSFIDEKENPLLWASTYHAGECLDPVAVKEAKLKKRVNKTTNSTGLINVPSTEHTHSEVTAQDILERPALDGNITCYESSNLVEPSRNGMMHSESNNESEIAEHAPSAKTMAIQGFKAQSEMVMDSLDRLITSWEQKNESVVIEGVHLSLNFVMGLMKKHPSIMPFMIYIENEEKHLERFAVRAKYMTLDPAKNKYVKYIRNIRMIQDYLCKRADKHLVPMVNNTNVDKSVAAIHATIFSSLHRREAGEPLYDQATNTVKVINQEYRSQSAASALGSKCMFQLIQRRGSSHHLMALMNTDGSVAKAWPVNTSVASCRGGFCKPVIGPLQIDKAEHVNLQFGNYGLSAFPGEVGETSYNGSADGQSSRGEGTESNGSHITSSCSSSPRTGGAEKELVDADEVSVSEEEPEEDTSAADTDDEFNDYANEHLEEFQVEGSVDESIDVDEETEDFLTAQDEDDEGYSSGKTEEENILIDVKPLQPLIKQNASMKLAPRDQPQCTPSWSKIYPSPDNDAHKFCKESESCRLFHPEAEKFVLQNSKPPTSLLGERLSQNCNKGSTKC